MSKEPPVADEKKPNAISRFFRETTGELKKVTWPTRAEAWQLTLIVLVVMAVTAIYLGIVDEIAFRLINLALGVTGA
jgi:preprotein translocase subunit SecE